MTDRELLEAAARAAGINLYVWGTPGDENFSDMSKVPPFGRWNPLADDGDALRLAVKLRITPHMDASLTDAESSTGFATEAHGSDPYAATRRAIVRAAAAMNGPVDAAGVEDKP